MSKGEEYMKKIQLILMGIVLMAAYGCNSNIYSEQLKKERKLIESYIARHGLIIVDTLPADDQWEENIYYRVPEGDNCYFHMVALGDTTFPEIEKEDEVRLRFKRYTLDEYPDTLSNWGTMDSADPIKLEYMVNSDNSCTGWQVALKYMKYPYSQCKIIVPSKMGFREENSTVTPYGYELKRTDNPIKIDNQ
jgi:hypothetical protein